MEAPPPSPPPLSAAPESIDSSPRSRHTDCWDTDAPPPKLRLMCSYGGHIVPRPHDKTLCYIGGDTRIIVVDRHASLADLHHRLSKTLLNNQAFTLKYQLPNEDLDSLISVTTDEDLDNMVEEYDRLHASAAGKTPGRLRLFLFPTATANIEQLLVETASTKSDDWFFNVLNGKPSNLSDRGFSESSSVNCLLGLDDDPVGKASAAASDSQIEGSKGGIGGNTTNTTTTVSNHDVHSVPDSPMLETTSSFGSTSSSPSVANLPPIRVKVEENLKTGVGLGIEEQFQHMAVGIPGNVNYAVAPPPQEVVPVVSGVPMVVGGEYASNRVVSDDERSDHSGSRKVQHIQHQVQPPQQIPQFQIKQGGVVDFPSSESVTSEGSITNHLARQRHHAMYQDSILQMQSGNLRSTADPKPIDQSNNAKIQMQQESGFVLPPQPQVDQIHHQQQFFHTGNQFIPAGAMPVTSYYPIYPHQQPLDQQYPFYFMPARPTQAYNYTEMPPTGSTRPQTPPAHITNFNQVPSSKPEMAPGVYRTGNPQLVQIPPSQHQPQYVGYTHVHHPSQSMAASSAVNPNYEFADPAHAQMYYIHHQQQQQQQPLPPQYQTLTSAPAAVLLPDGSGQLPTENMKQQVRNLPQ